MSPFGELPLESITTSMIERWLASLGRSASTRRLALVLMHGIFRRAVKVWGLPSNPAAGAEKPPLTRSSLSVAIFTAMMTRATAGPCLLSALEAGGVREGRIQLPAIWDALAAWLHDPVADVEPANDRRFFYLSLAPAAIDRIRETVFAGEPPTAIAGVDLICIEFGREFVWRTGPNSRRSLGSAALTLWYEAGPAWEPLRETPEWIELGVSTCNYDWSADGCNPTWLTSQLERSPVFKIASSERALAMTAGFSDENADGPDDVVIVASRPTSGY